MESRDIVIAVRGDWFGLWHERHAYVGGFRVLGHGAFRVSRAQRVLDVVA